MDKQATEENNEHRDNDNPSWLNEKFLEEALSNKYPGIHVKDLHIEPAVGKGENYACNVFRVKSNTSEGEINMFVKCMPETEFRAHLVREGEFAKREFYMYNTTLPLLRGDYPSPHYPECWYLLQDDYRDTIILKDLSFEGYKNHPRKVGLDAIHCKMALTELAHFHGHSVALRVQDPEKFKAEIVEKYEDNLFTDIMEDKMEPFLEACYPPMGEAIKKHLPYRFHAIGDIVIKIQETAFHDMQNDCKIPSAEELPNRVVVLNHGDFWMNNILFLYKDGGNIPVACSLVDFQIARCASPALDLLYFFFTSTEQATRREHMDYLLQTYIDEVRVILQVKGVADPGASFYKTIQEIKEDMKKYSMFGFLMSCFVFPIVIADSKDAPDFEKMKVDFDNQVDEKHFEKLYSGPLFCKRMKELLEDVDDVGIFAKYLNDLN